MVDESAVRFGDENSLSCMQAIAGTHSSANETELRTITRYEGYSFPNSIGFGQFLFPNV